MRHEWGTLLITQYTSIIMLQNNRKVKMNRAGMDWKEKFKDLLAILLPCVL